MRPATEAGLKAVDQQLHVGFKFSVVPEPGGEATDRHIGNRVEMVKIDAEIVFQFALVVGFQLSLIRRQERAIGIVNEVKDKVVLPAIAKPVQQLERPNTGIEDPAPRWALTFSG